MVAFFKLYPGRSKVHEITRENVEELLGRRPPWFRRGRYREGDRHFAVCPYCDNPIQLKALYKEHEDSPRPYGSHTGKPVDDFRFDPVDLAACPYKLVQSRPSRSSRRAPSALAEQLTRLAVEEFDRIVLVLRGALGFDFSPAMAGRMLEQWFDSEGYLYTGAHQRNLPWMIGYFAPALSLYGQRLGAGSELTCEIAKHCAAARISRDGRLVQGQGYLRLEMQCLHHKVLIDEDGHLHESMKWRVQDFTRTNEPGHAPVIIEREITFDPGRFEALIHTPPARARRDERLLALARDIAERKL